MLSCPIVEDMVSVTRKSGFDLEDLVTYYNESHGLVIPDLLSTLSTLNYINMFITHDLFVFVVLFFVVFLSIALLNSAFMHCFCSAQA